MLARIRSRLARSAFLWRHRGRRCHCPLCGYLAAEFAMDGVDHPLFVKREVVGAGRRPAKCHRCGSRDRDRLVYMALRDRLRVFDHPGRLRVLHVAPEMPLLKRLRSAGFADYVSGDLHAPGYQYPSYVQNLDVTDLPFPAEHFDLVLCNHVLEHVPDDLRAMRSILRIIKSQGRAILQVPHSLNTAATEYDPSVTDPRRREDLYGQADHVRLYGRDYVQRLESVGFVVELLAIAADYPRLGLDSREAVFVASKA